MRTAVRILDNDNDNDNDNERMLRALSCFWRRWFRYLYPAPFSV